MVICSLETSSKAQHRVSKKKQLALSDEEGEVEDDEEDDGNDVDDDVVESKPQTRSRKSKLIIFDVLRLSRKAF